MGRGRTPENFKTTLIKDDEQLVMTKTEILKKDLSKNCAQRLDLPQDTVDEVINCFFSLMLLKYAKRKDHLQRKIRQTQDHSGAKSCNF